MTKRAVLLLIMKWLRQPLSSQTEGHNESCWRSLSDAVQALPAPGDKFTETTVPHPQGQRSLTLFVRSPEATRTIAPACNLATALPWSGAISTRS